MEVVIHLHRIAGTVSTIGNTMPPETGVATEALGRDQADIEEERTMRVIGFVLSLLITATAAFGHGGGTDRNGCHHDRKNGGYHCH